MMMQTQRTLTEKKKASPLLLVALVGIMLSTLFSAYYPSLANAAQQGPATANGDKATLSFELTVEGEPPAGAEFLGFTTLESLMTTPLTDPDGDGIYTGSMTVPKFAPGGPPEPISLSTVRIVQGPPTGSTANGPEYRVIKDFGSVKLDGDKTFSASVSFEGDDGGPGEQEVSATGMIKETEASSYQYGTHTINDSSSGAPIYALESDEVNLYDYDGSVTIYGTLVAGYENGLDGGPPLVEVSRVGTAPPPGGGETYGVRGTITSISGSVVLVEEVPSTEESGDKGYFTVTNETEIARLEGDIRIPAEFEELEVGQQVQAAYAGAAAQSYPTQGEAESIVILDESGETQRQATLSFELTVEGEPPANAEFLGFTSIESLMTTPLTDSDGDGLYTGSMTVPATSGGQGGPPEPLSLQVRIVQGPPTGYDAHGPQYRVIKDFGLVKIDGDKTFSASVSFEGDGGSDNNDDGSDNKGGSNNGGLNSGGSGSSDSGSSSGGSSGGGGLASGLRGALPTTGGSMALTLLGAGVLLVGGGLLVRRVFR